MSHTVRDAAPGTTPTPSPCCPVSSEDAKQRHSISSQKSPRAHRICIMRLSAYPWTVVDPFDPFACRMHPGSRGAIGGGSGGHLHPRLHLTPRPTLTAAAFAKKRRTLNAIAAVMAPPKIFDTSDPDPADDAEGGVRPPKSSAATTDSAPRQSLTSQAGADVDAAATDRSQLSIDKRVPATASFSAEGLQAFQVPRGLGAKKGTAGTTGAPSVHRVRG